MRAGVVILFLIPVAFVLLLLNCVSWVLVRLFNSGLPVRMGVGWPWSYHTYAINKVGPSEWDFTALCMDVAVALGILLATAGLVLFFTRKNSNQGWR